MNILVMIRSYLSTTLLPAGSCNRWRHIAIVATGVWWTILAACTDPPPTLNPVQTIDPVMLNRVVAADSFNGFLVAFASWCPPCKEELPDLAKLYLKYKDQGIQIVAMSLDSDGPKAVQPLVNQLNIPFPVYWVGGSAMAAYGLIGVPTLIVIKEGMVVEKRPGRQSRQELERRIKTLIEEANKKGAPT